MPITENELERMNKVVEELMYFYMELTMHYEYQALASINANEADLVTK